jgi:membrane-associated phospholipid phosphatase
MKAIRFVARCAVPAIVLLAPLPARAQSASPPPAAPTPPPAAPVLEPGQHFVIDPVMDGMFTIGGGSLAALLGLVLSSGEIRPTQPGPTSNLLPIDRGTVTQTIDPHAGTYSTIGLFTAIGFAVLDPFLSAERHGWDAFLVDAVLYAETIAQTELLTDITKIAVRRPRPIDYLNCSTAAANASCTTDLQLSFFSGHASTVAAIGATATYLAFARDRHSARPWITLVLATALTSFVSYERVRAGQHFPTDVIAGSLAGATVGVIVPHLHHKDEAPAVWVGVMPAPGASGGSLTLSGEF